MISRKTLDLFRNLLATGFTILVTYLIWDCSWILAILGIIPIYFIFVLIIVFLTFPLQRLTSDYWLTKTTKESSNLYNNKEFKLNIKKYAAEFSPKNYSENNYTNATEIIENLIKNNMYLRNFS